MRATLLTMTYAVVVFSLLVQGLTLGKLVRATGYAPGAGRVDSCAPPAIRSSSSPT